MKSSNFMLLQKLENPRSLTWPKIWSNWCITWVIQTISRIFFKFWDFCPFLTRRSRKKKDKKCIFKFWDQNGQKPKIPKIRKSILKNQKKSQLDQKLDFLGHQVKICSTFGNSEVHWIDIACYILENQVRISGSI